MQVYLPDDLYAEVKARALPASELLQKAVRAEIRRSSLLEETDRYLEEMFAKHGQPSPEDVAWVEELVARVQGHFAAGHAD